MRTDLAKKAAVLLLGVLVALAALWPALDRPAEAHVAEGMQRALTAFAVARALNAAISVAQGTELAAGIGAQLTLAVGEVLDPVNDLVESFSDLMLMAAVAFGIQKILLLAGQHEIVKMLLIGVLCGWVAASLLGARRRWLDQLLALMLMVRFAIPLVCVGSEAVYARFLQGEFDRGEAALAAAKDSVDLTVSDMRTQQAPPPAATPDPGAGAAPPAQGLVDSLLEKLRSTQATLQSLDPGARLARLKEELGRATEHLINLIVVFLLQTLVVPVVLLWLMYAALRAALGGRA